MRNSEYWIDPDVDFDTRQKQVLEKITTQPGPHWITGYAGTGKTILLACALEKIRARHPKAALCYVTYTHALCELARSGFGHLDIKISTVHSFLKPPPRGESEKTYDYIFVDEIQDIKEKQIQAIKKRGKHLIWSGDPAQSIFQGRLKQAEIPAIVGTRPSELKNIYRLSEETWEIASTIYREARPMKDACVFTKDVTVEIAQATTQEQEFRWVWRKVKLVSKKAQPAAVLFSTHNAAYSFACLVANQEKIPKPPKRVKMGGAQPDDYSEFNSHFKGRKVPLQFLGGGNGKLLDSEKTAMCYLMTYASAKGLDFSSVFLPSLTEDTSFDGKPWGTTVEMQERYLFVALTRSRRDLYMSYNGSPHEYLSEMPKKYYKSVKC